jgi:hypothetical protein
MTPASGGSPPPCTKEDICVRKRKHCGDFHLDDESGAILHYDNSMISAFPHISVLDALTVQNWIIKKGDSGLLETEMGRILRRVE